LVLIGTASTIKVWKARIHHLLLLLLGRASSGHAHRREIALALGGCHVAVGHVLAGFVLFVVLWCAAASAPPRGSKVAVVNQFLLSFLATFRAYFAAGKVLRL
jgi:hypothetical protein